MQGPAPRDDSVQRRPSGSRPRCRSSVPSLTHQCSPRIPSGRSTHTAFFGKCAEKLQRCDRDSVNTQAFHELKNGFKKTLICSDAMKHMTTLSEFSRAAN